MAFKPASLAVLVIEVIAVVAVTIKIVTVTYETRNQFAELEQLRNHVRVLQEEWGKLLLEESAFSSASRVERIAREELRMISPSVEDIRELKNKK